ncbi:MAG: hypothetical protein ABL928_08455 [Sphingorhabdus sp.]
MHKPAFLKLLICIDLVVCAAMALPWVSTQFLAALSYLNALAELGGGPINFPANAFFFVNLAGIFGVAYNVIMLKSDESWIHLINNVARLCVVALLAFYIGIQGLPQIFLLFMLTELVGFYVTKRWLHGLADAS